MFGEKFPTAGSECDVRKLTDSCDDRRHIAVTRLKSVLVAFRVVHALASIILDRAKQSNRVLPGQSEVEVTK